MKSKILFTVIIAALTSLQATAQWTSKSFVFESTVRQYSEYVSPDYNASVPASLVIMLHGLGGSMTNFYTAGIDIIADTANIIAVAPQALIDVYAGAAWNSGAGVSGYYPNATINDVGFINALIDTVISGHAINLQQVYLCGMSMGGFMTQRMACESNQKIAAFASVAGTIGNGISLCNPGRAVPVAHFHGTSDQTVGYYVNSFGINVDSLIRFWVSKNKCDTTAVHTVFPDIAGDGYTVENFLYPDVLNNSHVELFRVNNAAHVWLVKPLNDISYTEEIWKFFRKHKLQTSIKDVSADAGLNVFPNPAGDNININILRKTTDKKFFVQLYSMQGMEVFSGQFSTACFSIPTDKNKMKNGIYLLRISGEEANYNKLVVVER